MTAVPPGSLEPSRLHLPPLVFAHRGSSAVQPEHTLGAYLQAIAEGADGLECDVRLTRDGHLVCLHDRRLERTSNGRGRVSTHTLAQLDELDFGSWHPGLPESADDLILDRPGATRSGPPPSPPAAGRTSTSSTSTRCLRPSGTRRRTPPVTGPSTPTTRASPVPDTATRSTRSAAGSSGPWSSHRPGR